MARLRQWLDCEPGTRETINLVLLSVPLLFALSYTSAWILAAAGSPVPARSLRLPSNAWIFYIFLRVALTEEFLFRVIPLGIAVSHRASFRTIMITVVLSSIVFGFLHGSWQHIFIQGWGGLIFSALFLKCGGLHRNYFRGWLTCAAAHYAYNTAVVLLFLAI